MIFRSGPTDSKVWDKKGNRYVDSHITISTFFIVLCGFKSNMQIVMRIWKTRVLMNPFVLVYKTDVMAMHREGLLNAEEFKTAKRVLLGL